jgi:hypothetical protein
MHHSSKEGTMRRIPKAIYLSVDEIDARIVERTVEAHKHPADSKERQTILKEIAQLRMHADAKRWIESPGLKPGR